MREALYTLSRCVETADKLHNQLYCDTEGPQTFDLVAGLPNYFKLDCVTGSISPIIIKFEQDNQHDDITVYGSFNCKEPSNTNNQLLLRNPKRIKILEPLGRNIFAPIPLSQTAPPVLPTFYITICSLRGNSIRLTSLAKIDLRAVKKSKQRSMLPTTKTGNPGSTQAQLTKTAATSSYPDLSDNFITHLQARSDI